MNRRTLRPLAAVTCALALSLTAACGGDDGKKDASKDAKKLDPEAAAVESYQDKVNESCRTALTRITDGIGNVTAQSSEAAKKAAFATAGKGIVDEAAALRKISAPASVSADVAAWIDIYEAAGRKVQNNGLALAEAGKTPFDKSDAEAARLGLTECVLSK